jgi:hypothetical protein
MEEAPFGSFPPSPQLEPLPSDATLTYDIYPIRNGEPECRDFLVSTTIVSFHHSKQHTNTISLRITTDPPPHSERDVVSTERYANTTTHPTYRWEVVSDTPTQESQSSPSDQASRPVSITFVTGKISQGSREGREGNTVVAIDDDVVCGVRYRYEGG